MNDAIKIMNLKENKGLVHLDQPKYLFNILLFHHFLSDYLKKKKKKKMRCQSGLIYILTKEALPSPYLLYV